MIKLLKGKRHDVVRVCWKKGIGMVLWLRLRKVEPKEEWIGLWWKYVILRGGFMNGIRWRKLDKKMWLVWKEKEIKKFFYRCEN